MRNGQAVLVFTGIIAIVLIIYAGTGVVYAGVLVGSADRTLNTVVSHQNSLNTSFNEIDEEVAALNGNAAFNPEQDITLIDKSVADSQVATQTIKKDDASLASVEGQLKGSRWLTLVGHSSIDRESARVTHARNALGAASTIAADQARDGNFWHLVYAAFAYLDQANSQADAGNLTTAKTRLATVKDRVDQAVQASKAPGLPADLQTFVVDMQTFISDYGKQLDAQISGDDASVTDLLSTVASDQRKLASYDFSKIGNEIDVYYKPLIDRFNSEINAATS